MRLIPFFLSLFCVVCQAQEAVRIPSLANGKTGKSRCLSELGGRNKQCWTLKSIQSVDIPNSSDTKFTKVRLVEIGIQSSGVESSFVVGVSWEGQSAGVLSFSGPKGTLFAIGSISKTGDNSVHIETFSDESLSQEFDRGVIFGESDPQKLRQKTLDWLNDVVTPFLEKSVLDSPIQNRP